MTHQSRAWDGSDDDRRDGFIHLSTTHQLRETADKHFADAVNLFAMEVDLVDLDVRWELSRDNARFPHVYGSLPRTSLKRTLPVRLGGDDVPLPWERALVPGGNPDYE